MKKILATVFALMVIFLSVSPAYADKAEGGKVTYDGNAQTFIYEPGSDYSPSDLFTEFKGVMPGDTLTQKITVKNDASEKVKVKIYLRSLGAQENSVELLSQLGLKVQKSSNNQMSYMFDAAANETAQLTDWVCLGTLYSGGEVNLDVILEVPVELDSSFQNAVGYLDWEFRVEEFPIGPNDPKPPKTGDNSNLVLWTTLCLVAGVLLIILLLWRKKDEEEEKKSAQI